MFKPILSLCQVCKAVRWVMAGYRWELCFRLTTLPYKNKVNTSAKLNSKKYSIPKMDINIERKLYFIFKRIKYA